MKLTEREDSSAPSGSRGAKCKMVKWTALGTGGRGYHTEYSGTIHSHSHTDGTATKDNLGFSTRHGVQRPSQNKVSRLATLFMPK